MYLTVRLFTFVVALVACDRVFDCSIPKITAIGGVYVNKVKTHFVEYGHSVEIFCSCDSSNRLEIYKFNMLHSEIINSTTIRTVFKVSSSSDSTRIVECRNTCTSTFSSDYRWIKGDYYPEILDFECFSENFDVLHISWSTPNNEGNYSLSAVSTDGTVMAQICRRKLWYKPSYTCMFDLNNLEDVDPKNPHVIFLLEICNYFGCVNQTRDFDLLRITKLAAPAKLTVRYFTDAYDQKSIYFDWIPYTNSPVSKMELYFVIEYWLTDISGMKPRLAKSGTDVFYRRVESSHRINLPCPDKQYTLRASFRPASAPSKYMSDYGYVTFHTDPDPEVKLLDPICKIKPIVENPPVMVYKIQLLRKYVDEEIEKLKNLKRSLQDKAAGIKVIQNSVERDV